MKNLDFKKLAPYLAAVVIFLIITFAYLTPLLEGKRLMQSDIIHFQGMSKEIVDYRAKTGQEPLWTNSMFGGMPAYQISTKYTGNVLGYADKILSLGLPHPANLVFLYFLGFFILLLVMGVNPWLSIVGAIGFAFSSYFFIIFDAGHNSKAHAIAYMAPVIAGMILTMKRKYLWGGLLTTVFLSLEVKANHPQITYYLAMIALILGIFKLIHAIRFKELMPFLKAVGVLVIAVAFAVLTNLTSLWATWEYGKYTIRGKSELSVNKANKTTGLDKDYVTQWSYGIAETMTLLVPNIYGGSSNLQISEKSKVAEAMKANGLPDESIQQFTSQPLPFIYWGSQPFTSGPVYVGAIFIFLFILGLIIVKGPVKWWLLSATILSIILAWGHNLMPVTDFFLTFLPGYNKFRAVTMILVIAEFAIPLLGILAVRELTAKDRDVKVLNKGFMIALIISGGICLILALLPGAFFNFTGPKDAMYQQQYQFPEWLMQSIRDERLRLLRLDAIRSLVFILLAGGLMWTILFNKIKKEYAYLILGVLILADMFPVNKRYFNNDGFTSKSRVENPYSPSDADNIILKDPALDFRVLNLTLDPYNDASTSYFHKSIGGYHGAKLRRYQELIDHGIDQDIQTFIKSMSTLNTPVLNMLNTRYLIIPGQDKRPAAYPNTNALGNAWFAKNYQLVDNADAEIAAMKDFKPDSVVIVNKSFADQLKGFQPACDSSDVINLINYEPNKLMYEYTSRNKALAVFSEIYYPKGWNAFVDGQPAPHFRANYVLRAMILPEGNHKIEFRFEPVVYSMGETISLVSSLIVIALVLIAIFFEFWKTRKSQA
ncbi:MAG: YfhO family protein [Bacteroidales bacterium]|nr:YfhO family protein [Bacteroidales bacterium]HNW73636.1 YfhO family protein [Bacteroidales bacterium]HPS49947.1 YfhO family protein [Bacteroidales bacterium]